MKELIILIVMMFPEYGRYPDSIAVNGLHGKPLSFTTREKCADHVNKNIDAYIGIDFFKPPKSDILLVCLRSYKNPTSINNAPEVMP